MESIHESYRVAWAVSLEGMAIWSNKSWTQYIRWGLFEAAGLADL